MRHYLVPILSLWICYGCGTLSVTSSPPEAEVEVLLPGKETPKSLGKTPYSVDLSELEEIVNEGTVVIVVTKRGYLPQRFVVPNIASGELTINANLLPNLPSNFREINRIITLVLKAERLIIQDRLPEALEIAKEIKNINENIALAYEIEGTVHFLQNSFKESRFSWIRSLELEPNNPEAQTMLSKIEENLGKTPTPQKE